MLNQIELYRAIPKFRTLVHGVIEETCSHLAEIDEDNARRVKEHLRPRGNTAALKGKYHDRLERLKDVLPMLAELQRCLNE